MNFTKNMNNDYGLSKSETAGSRFPFTAPKKTITAQECQDSYDKVNDTHPFKKVVHITDEVMCADVGPNREDSCSVCVCVCACVTV